MRKIYSIVLTACALLVSASLFAATTVNDADALRNAISNGESDIVIGLSFVVTGTPITVFADPTQKITINLNGKIISTTTLDYVFWILKGNVEFTGAGEIQNNHSKTEKMAILIEGQGDPEVANYSVLTIGKDVTVQAPNAGKAIVIDGTLTDDYYPYANEEALNGMTIGTYIVDGGASRNIILNRNGQEVSQLYTYNGKKYSAANTLKTNANNKLYGANKFATYLSPTTTTLYTKDGSNYSEVTDTYYKMTAPSVSFAYGVNVTINGKVYGGQYGVKINGYVKKLNGASEENLPTITISKDAEVYAHATNSDATGVYSSGYGKFIINGFVHGATGVYIKSGKVDLVDAVVKSDYTGDYTEPAGKRSGVDAGGSAIVIESNASYNGGQELKIEGDTKVEGGSGYAIEEAITTAVDTKVSSIVVEGGTIIAGGEGTAVVTAKTADNKVVEIVGGNVEDGGFYVKDEQGNNVPASADDFVPTTGYITTTIQDENGRNITVVTEGETPAGETSVANAASTSVNWIGTAEALDADVDIDYLEINNNEPQVLTVNEGVTLTVGRIVMGAQAQIIVKAGARLIVDGAQGIVAPAVSNLVLETSETTPAQFLFNPAVSSNRHPNATVMFTSKAYRKADGSNIYQFFGSPFTAVTNVTASSADYATQLDVWNVNKYDRIGIINYDKVGLPASNAVNYSLFNRTFAFYSMMTNNPQGEEQTYTFKGTLVGNENAELPLYANWAAMSNSYMGTISMDALIEANRARRAEGMQVTLTPYVYSQDGNELHWNANSPLAAGYIKNIAPMQPFMLQNNGDYAEIVNDYADLVWTPGTTSNAPARRNIAADMTKATIRVNGNGMSDMVTIAESAEFTAELDELDAVMYPNTDINLYAMAAEKMSVLATDDLDNTYLGFACPNGGEFTLTFAGVEGNALTLIDLKNNTAVDMTEGGTYTFTAASNEANDYRFKVVGRRNAATALENTDASVKSEGIYTLTGMYLGNMSVWNTLPAGVYVVNGEKMVK